MQESVSTYAEHRDVDALADIAGLPDISSILDVCARVTGMGYTVVAHVSDDRWVACAVLDLVDFGLPVGGELPVQSTLCSEVRANRRLRPRLFRSHLAVAPHTHDLRSGKLHRRADHP